MKRLIVGICCVLFSASALADVSLSQWLNKQSDRGAQIEVIRVESKKPLVAIKETDAQIENILKEAEALEEDTVDHEKVEDSS